MNEDIRRQCERYRNAIRLAQYKQRRAEFIEKYSKTPDNEYEAYYGADMAGYIDARQWWEHLDKDKERIAQEEAKSQDAQF